MGNPRILILDDDPDFLGRLARVLSSAGFEALTVADVKSAEGILMGNEPKIDAFIVDLVLPGNLSGFDVISAVTRKTPPFKIIAASCVYRQAVLEYMCERLGVDAFVEKSKPGEPFNAVQWLHTIRRVLDEGGTSRSASA